MTRSATQVGVVGCGNISDTYFSNLKHFLDVEVTACADLDRERAEKQAAAYGIPRVCGVDELLADPAIGIVLNLTIPRAHASIALAAIESGKAVYNEKPLALTRDEGRNMLDQADQRHLRVGGAPDTFLGAGLQTCRKLIDDGAIGDPIGASAFMLCHGHESWHPNPDFYYQPGGGPMFDMGPYYLTALVSLLGPAVRVTGSARASFAQRTVSSAPRRGQTIDVEVPTHVTGIVDFAQGAIATIVTSFDVWATVLPSIEIYGTTGTLQVPDPNGFGGPVRVREAGSTEWRDVQLTHPHAGNARGLGVADMAHAIQTGRPHRASGELAYHVLDIMHAIHDASSTGRHVVLQSTCAQPAPLPLDLAEYTLDD